GECTHDSESRAPRQPEKSIGHRDRHQFGSAACGSDGHNCATHFRNRNRAAIDSLELEIDLSGTAANATAIKVDGSAVTQPVSGTVTANAGTGTFNIQSNASVNVNQIGGNAVAADSNGRQLVKLYPDTTTASYHASKKFAASSTTDIAVLPGNASNTVLVTRVTLTCTQSTAGEINVELLKRSTADTGGTSSGFTEVPDDSSYAAASSALLSYTGTGPSVGTAVGDLDNAQVGCMAAGTATPNDIYIFRPAKPIVLRGTAQ